MTVPKWLIPVLSVVAALAVAVAAAFVGASLVPDEPVVPTETTVVAPVLAPLPTTDGKPSSDAVSETVAEARVPVGTSEDAPDAALERLIPYLASEDDPILALDEAERAEPEGPTDDPCATDAAPADCPEGLHGTILPLVASRSLFIRAQAFPPASGAVADPQCAVSSPVEGQTPIGIAASSPGAFTLEYWPAAHPGLVTSVVFESDETAIAAFEAAMLTETDPFALPYQYLCGEIPTTTGVLYAGMVTGIDINSSIATTAVRFHSSGDRVHPGLTISPIGDNLVYTSVLHTPDEVVDVRATTIAPGGAVECGERGATPLEVHSGTGTVTEDHLERNNILAGNTERNDVLFEMTEGTTAVFCASWFDADAPSFDTDQATFTTTIVVNSPDLVTPTVTLESVDLAGGDTVTSATMIARLGSRYCGGGTNLATVRVPDTICRYPSRGVTSWDGSVTVGTRIELASGEVVQNDFVMALGKRTCGVDGCPTPSEAWYGVPLADVGTATLHVTWEQGASNRANGWGIGLPIDRSPSVELDDLPQLNTDNDFVAVRPPGAISETVGTTIEADRPVSFVARLFSRSGSTPCTVGTGVTTVSGRAENAEAIQFSGLCLGAHYIVDVTLTDDDGNVSTWGPGLRLTTGIWPSAYLVIPGFAGTVRYEMSIAGQRNTYVQVARVTLGEDIVVDAGDQCLGEPPLIESGSIPLAVATETAVVVDVRVLTSAAEWSPTDCDTRLNFLWPRESTRVELALDELLMPDGVIVNIGGTYGTVLHVWVDPR